MRSPLLGLVLLLSGCVDGDGGLLIGTTTTVQDTGLLDRLLAAFEKDTGIEARAAVGGTGETIERGRLGDVDVLFTHSPARERSLLADGTASARHPVMWGRFLIAGPPDDPAGIKQAPSPADAFARIAANRSTFVSRADGSGTHDKELAVWSAAGLDPASFHHAWYKETGTGQGTTLLVAAEFDAYILIDEATLLQFHD
ncbi:MAG: substrate-binding domain-containing protein, partial [Euryarchaeota archaeon]|nr:substrate-binding domain-containing protein [Euryarchaeota archaeon]